MATYDLKPEMSAPEVTDKLVAAIESGNYDLVVCNYANGDMVGHTGKYEAAVKAAEALDVCLQRVSQALNAVGGQGLVTADHGNAEQMQDPVSGQPHTAHTTTSGTLVYLGEDSVKLKEGGKLSDVAPTLLALMHIPQPREMSEGPCSPESTQTMTHTRTLLDPSLRKLTSSLALLIACLVILMAGWAALPLMRGQRIPISRTSWPAKERPHGGGPGHSDFAEGTQEDPDR